MNDYQPVRLAAWCNLEAEAVPEGIEGPFGLQNLRGLPFEIGPRFLGFGVGSAGVAVEVPLGLAVRWIIVAHRLLESHILEGEPVGRRIATYRFRYADGEEVAVPIRERFEIAVVPVRWGQKPFLAMPDLHDHLMPRYEGEWDSVMLRQTEARQAWPKRFFLWAWQNPHPERELAGLCIEPSDRPFIIGGLTASALDEDPLGREPRRPVKITLSEAERADQPFALSVEVDRGVATYPHPLPPGTPQDFVEDAFRGWGEPQSRASSPAYVEIAAQPSATVHLRQGSEEIAAVRWGDVLAQGAAQTPSARLEIVDRGKNWVHVTVLDDETGQPAPCRVHFRSPEGIPYQPYGHHNHLLQDEALLHIDIGGDVRLGHVTYAYIDGKCQGWLPRGDVLVDVARGFEYEPLRARVSIAPGQRELTLRLKRWTNLNAEGWFSGDSHVHFLSTPGALLEAQGEDLNVVNLLQSQWGHLFTSTEEFIGRPVAAPDGRTIVYASQENRQHILGHLSLLGLKRPVMPWCTDGPEEAELGGTLESTLSHWADQAHAQGGTVIIPHMPTPNGEQAALIATGRADAVEMLQHDMYRHIEYYRYLNGGYRLPLVGGTDKMSTDVPVGLYRTYVHIPPGEPFDYESWCNNLRLGRTFLSGGPILRFGVEGAQIGDTVYLPGNGGTVEVWAEAQSVLPIHSLQVVQEGQVVAEAEERDGTHRLSLKTSLRVERHSWLVARVGGPGYTTTLLHYDHRPRGVMAHTSPIYLAVGGEWWMQSPETAQYMLTLVHGSLEYIRHRAVYHTHGEVTHHHGEADHQAYLERPFHEAMAAINRRMGW